jgi:hypothetical protein
MGYQRSGYDGMSRLSRAKQQGFICRRLQCKDDDEVAVCSRPLKWQWWSMIFQLGVLLAAIIISFCPSKLRVARQPLAIFFSMTSVLIMICIDANMTAVWEFSDLHVNPNNHPDGAKRKYLSTMALTAGFVSGVEYD